MRVPYSLLLLLLGVCSCKSSVDTQTLRFKMIADAQQYSNDQTLSEAKNRMQRLAADVDKNRNMPKDEAVLKQAQDILAYTKATAIQLRVVREAIISRLGSANQLNKLGNKEIVSQVLFQPDAPTSISNVHHQLRVYATYMKPLVPQLPESLGLVPEDATTHKSSSRERDDPDSYADFYFEGTTAAEALAVLAQQEAEVLHLGLEAIKQQSNKVGLIVDGFNRVGAYAIPESRVVRPGEKYKADLMMVASYSGIRPLQMTVNGSEIAVEAGQGRVEFIVPQLPPGRSSVEAHWDGTISFREYDGRDTAFRVRVPYTIRK